MVKFYFFIPFFLVFVFFGRAFAGTYNLEKKFVFSERDITYVLEPSSSTFCTYLMNEVTAKGQEVEFLGQMDQRGPYMIKQFKPTSRGKNSEALIDDVVGVRGQVEFPDDILERGKITFAPFEIVGGDFQNLTFPGFDLPVHVTSNSMEKIEFEVTSEGLTKFNEVLTEDIIRYLGYYPHEDLTNWIHRVKPSRSSPPGKLGLRQIPVAAMVSNFIERIFLGGSAKGNLSKLEKIHMPPSVTIKSATIGSIKFTLERKVLTMSFGPQTYSYSLAYDL